MIMMKFENIFVSGFRLRELDAIQPSWLVLVPIVRCTGFDSRGRNPEAKMSADFIKQREIERACAQNRETERQRKRRYVGESKCAYLYVFVYV